MLGIYFCPESPRWLMKKNRYPKAFRSQLKLRAHPIIAARDLYYSHVLYEEELKMARGANYFARFRDLFTVPRIRRATWASGMVMLGQQMCGINSESAPGSKTWRSLMPAQSSPSTLPPSLSMAVSQRRRLCTPRSGLARLTCERFRFSLEEAH